MTFSRFLHPVEYTDLGRHGASDTLSLARAYRAELHVVHVRSRRQSKEEEAAAQMRLRNFVAGNSAVPLTFETAIVYGDPVSAVAAYARSIEPDLVVVGRTGRRGSRLWRTGVFAKELASAVHCPTFVLPFAQNRTATEADALFKNILCPVDSSPAAAAASELALALAQQSGSRLTTFHVLEGDRRVDGIARDEAILTTVRKLNPDLIVIGLPIRGRFDAVFMRSTAALVVRHADCAVLMVPAFADPTQLATPMGTGTASPFFASRL
jgi:nucleotide-binding universal stress UspA family protein